MWPKVVDFIIHEMLPYAESPHGDMELRKGLGREE